MYEATHLALAKIPGFFFSVSGSISQSEAPVYKPRKISGGERGPF